MTSYFKFTPSHHKVPSFTFTFDGRPYSVRALWNISSQRYFLNCQSIENILIFMLPLIESQPAIPIKSLNWDSQGSRIILETNTPHNMMVGETISINIINCVPTTYNGVGFGFILSPTQIAYPMLTNPGIASTMGQLDMFISMTKGYFSSTLVFRNQAFEVNP